MKLTKLTKQNIHQIKGKKIYGFEFDKSYLRELDDTFGLLGDIDIIIDDNARNQGWQDCGTRNIKVCGTENISIDMLDEGNFLIMSDYFFEAYDKLCSILGASSDKDIFYFENHETAIDMEYRDKYRNDDLHNIIVFRSGPHASAYVKGMDFSDNARALFEYMLAYNYNEKYELIWFVKTPSEFIRYAGIKNVSFIGYDWNLSPNQLERDEYYRALFLAKYIFFTDAYGFARNCRSDQIRVQLWHGCGFKTRTNFVRCEHRYEYNIVISDVYSRIHQKIYGLREDQILLTGYAKADWLFQPIDNFREKLQLPYGEKYIFWLPTFRSSKGGLAFLNEYEFENQTGLPVVNTIEKFEKINNLLECNNVVLIIKLHPFQDGSKIKKFKYSNIAFLENDFLIEKDVQINQVLASADAMISDYSSAAVDYMLLNRPIAFTLEDAEEYRHSRGFVFENIEEWLPGKEIYNYDDFCKFIEEICNDEDVSKDKRKRLLQIMHKYHDGDSCKRIIEALNI